VDLTGFIAAIIPIALSPGASFSMAVSNAAGSGFRGVVPVILGTAAGISVHATLAGLGVSRLMIRSPAAMHALRIFGAIYLFWLAFRMIKDGAFAARRIDVNSARSVGLTDAITANLLNIKPLVLYLTVVPLFLGVEPNSYFVAASIHISIMAAFLALCGAAFAIVLKNGRGGAIAFVNVVAGVVLLAVAVSAVW
jgi:threonine/homoserine/homoserine lactone efflux protein